MVYATKQFNTPLQAEEVVQTKLTLEGVAKMSFAPKHGQSAADLAAEKRKVVSVAGEISAML